MPSNFRFSLVASALVILTAVVGCASEQAKLPPPRERVSYLDTNAFDRSLTSSLSANLDTVEIPVDDRISPIAIPERLNKWLAAVDAKGGNVEVKQIDSSQGKTRGFPIVLIGLAIEVIRLLREDPPEKLYQPAAGYDADIFVRQEPGGERIIERVVMRRKVVTR
jgi:hypothetical protein